MGENIDINKPEKKKKQNESKTEHFTQRINRNKDTSINR